MNPKAKSHNAFKIANILQGTLIKDKNVGDGFEIDQVTRAHFDKDGNGSMRVQDSRGQWYTVSVIPEDFHRVTLG